MASEFHDAANESHMSGGRLLNTEVGGPRRAFLAYRAAIVSAIGYLVATTLVGLIGGGWHMPDSRMVVFLFLVLAHFGGGVIVIVSSVRRRRRGSAGAYTLLFLLPFLTVVFMFGVNLIRPALT